MATPDLEQADGVYSDPLHAPTTASANIYHLSAPWFGGLRVLSRTRSNSNQFVCLGNDDGVHWWTLYGSFTDKPSGAVKMGKAR